MKWKTSEKQLITSASDTEGPQAKCDNIGSIEANPADSGEEERFGLTSMLNARHVVHVEQS